MHDTRFWNTRSASGVSFFFFFFSLLFPYFFFVSWGVFWECSGGFVLGKKERPEELEPKGKLCLFSICYKERKVFVISLVLYCIVLILNGFLLCMSVTLG